MDISKIFQDHSENIEEIMEKATGCNSAEELLTVADEYGIEIDAAQAEEILKLIKQPSLLTEDELAQVAGGKNYGEYCPRCGGTDIRSNPASYPLSYSCNTCGYRFYSSEDPRHS